MPSIYLSSPSAEVDSKATFLPTPWCAALLEQPNIICRVPSSRAPKYTNEDSLFAETLKTSRTIISAISFWVRPSRDETHITEVSTLLALGSGMDGHPGIMHGGIVGSILDEAMGILFNANHDRDHLMLVREGKAHGEMPPEGISVFTAWLNVKYLKPVMTPSIVISTAKLTKVEGRKRWVTADIRQTVGDGGEEILCATGEAMFIEPRSSKI